MNLHPTVSVVIALYNKSPCVDRVIQSVRSQSMQDFEIIIVDDGSTAEGLSIAEKISEAPNEVGR